MDRPSGAVEDRRVEPAKIRPKADAPENAGNVRRRQSKRPPLRRRRPDWRVNTGRRGVEVFFRDIFVDAGVDAVVKANAFASAGAGVGPEKKLCGRAETVDC